MKHPNNLGVHVANATPARPTRRVGLSLLCALAAVLLILALSGCTLAGAALTTALGSWQPSRTEPVKEPVPQ